MFVDENGEYSSRIHHRSHLAVGVPGTVAGFALGPTRGTARPSGPAWSPRRWLWLGTASRSASASPLLWRGGSTRFATTPPPSPSSSGTGSRTAPATPWCRPIWRPRSRAIRDRGPRRLLRRRDGASPRRGDGARRRLDHRGGPRPLPGGGAGTGAGHLPRLRRRQHGAAVVGGDRAGADAQRPGRLRRGRDGGQLPGPRAPPRRGDAARVPRPGALSRRPGLRRRAGGAAHEQGVRGRDPGHDQGGGRRGVPPGRRSGPSRPGRHRDHALLGGGRRRHGRVRDLHARGRVRLVHHRAGRGLPAQQRDGRLQRPPRV